jgi:large subunit ribosomal protein L30
MADITVTQVRSTAGTSPNQRATLRSLKLGKIGRTSTVKDGPQTQGMLRVVEHLVTIEEGK